MLAILSVHHANEKRCRELVENSIGIITVLVPVVGYQKAADTAKEALAQGKSVLEIVVEKKLLDPETAREVLDPRKMLRGDK